MAQDPIDVIADVLHSLIDVAAGRKNLPPHEADAHHDAVNAAVDSVTAATPGASSEESYSPPPLPPQQAVPGVFGG